MKKAVLLTLLSIVLLNSISYAQTRLKSTVVDQNSAPVIGATILIQNDSTHLGKLTDVTGTFEVELAPGNYSLEVRYLGFQPSISTMILINKGDGIFEQAGSFNHNPLFISFSMTGKSIRSTIPLVNNNL